MVRIPVTLADFESGRIKSSITKFSKYHPDQPVKPKRSVVQQTFAQVLGYGGYEELRSQAKKSGPAYSGQSLAIEQFIAPISLRISRYWSVSAEEAENIAVAVGLMHLDAFRPTVRTIQHPVMQEDRVSPHGRLLSIGSSLRPVFDAVRRATLIPMAQIATLGNAMKPSAQMVAIQEAMKPMAHIAALGNALKPSDQMAAIQEAMKPMAHIAALGNALTPSAQMVAIQEAMKPMAHLAALGDALKPSAQMAAIQEAMKPMAHIAAILNALKPTPH